MCGNGVVEVGEKKLRSPIDRGVAIGERGCGVRFKERSNDATHEAGRGCSDGD